MTNPFDIPVLVYEEGMELPKTGTYYVVAGNGLFLHKDMPLVSCFVKVDAISILPDLETDLKIESKMPKVPAKHIVKIKEFFRLVVEKHRSEACVTLYYNSETKDWKIHVAEQRASGIHVNYNRYSQAARENPEYAGYQCVGTIHSHCDFGAFHSGVDVHDEEDFDGIHGTFGHNDKDEFTVSASIVINGERTKVDPLTMFDGLAVVEPLREIYKLSFPKEHREMMEQGVEEWLAKVNAPSSSIMAGDLVGWKGNASPLRATYGHGPFQVEAVNGDMLTLEGKESSFVLASQMFKKV